MNWMLGAFSRAPVGQESENLDPIELCEGDPNLLLLAAAAGVNFVRDPPPLRNPDDSSEQLAVDRLTIAFLALAEVLGIGEEAETLVS
jgi:hypothetical protein